MNSLILAKAQDPTLQTFENDVWWIVLIKLLGVFVMLLLLTLFTINYERKVVARMAVRPGPNQVGPKGWLQSLTDGVKLPFKEEIIPKTADKVIYFIAPVISATVAFTAFSVIPFGPVVSMFGHQTALQLTDVPVSVLLGQQEALPDKPRKLVLDLEALSNVPEAAAIQRFARSIVLERGDFNGRVLSIRRDDLRAICALLQVDTPAAIAQLEAWGALVDSPAAFE